MLQGLRGTLEYLVTVDGTPRRTAAALALGVGLGFSPLLGLQILIGFGAAFVFRLSRLAVLIGLCANLPWIMLPWYAVTTAAAAALLGTSSKVDLGESLRRLLSVPFYQAAFWAHAGDLLGAFLWPFLLGPTVGAVILGSVTYVVALGALTRRARRKVEAARAAPLVRAALARDAEERAADGHVHEAQRAGLDSQ